MDLFPGDGVRALDPRSRPPAQRLEDVHALVFMVCEHVFWHHQHVVITMYYVQRVQAVIDRVLLVRHSGRCNPYLFKCHRHSGCI